MSMKYVRLRFVIILLCGILFPVEINSGNHAVSFSAPLTATGDPLDKMSNILKNSFIPDELTEVLRASHSRYLEGCELIQAGNSEKARVAFNEAVDLLLSPHWDMTSTLHLNLFFQDLIQRIPKQKSLYSDNSSSLLRGKNLIPLNIATPLNSAFASHLQGTGYEIPITINREVAKSIYYWLNDGRRFFIEGMVRSGRYLPTIQRIFHEESIPLDLMYLAQVESLFKPTAFSKARARGIWQFNRETAIKYGLKVTRDIDERSDPEKSTRAAAMYLKDLYGIFGDWNLVLAAYNCGEGKLDRLIKRSGVRDFWKLAESEPKLPKETKNHVPLIHASIILARNPEKFGLPVAVDSPPEFVEVSVSKPVDLRAVAQILNITIDQIKDLNPSLRSLRTPSEYPDYRLKVPAESDADLRIRLVALSAMIEPSLELTGRHKVLPGENLIKIASQYQVTVPELMEVNKLTSKHRIVAGRWINVPYTLENIKSTSSLIPNSVSTIYKRTWPDLSGEELKDPNVSKSEGSRIAYAPFVQSMKKGSTAESVP
jgi:hypothetical protein